MGNKSSLGVKELRNYKLLLQQLFAELLSTFLFLTISPLADQGAQLSVLHVGLSNGLLIASIVQIAGNISGGHFNPAITLGSLICRRIKLLRALCYIAVQILGGIAGAATSYAVLSTPLQENYGAILPYNHYSIFALELILTFVLVSVALSVSDPLNGGKGLGSSALAIGLSVTAGQCSCIFYSVGMNPVRMLSPAIVGCVWKSHGTSTDWSRVWIYIVAPLAGALGAGLVHRFVLHWTRSLWSLKPDENIVSD